jgi:hypothetical protein
MLFVSLGDDQNLCSAQDLTVLGGEILRLDVSGLPGAGSGPPPKADITPIDNPFPGADENERLAYAHGLRNPFRFSIDPLSGDVMIGDCGHREWEEIDQVPASNPGQNFGWPILEGLEPFVFCIPTCACSTDTSLTDPAVLYPHPDPGVFGPAAIGGATYYSVPGSPISFPSSYDGDYFFADWGLAFLRRVTFGPSGWEIAPPVSGQPSPENWAEGILMAVDFEVGPDGALYFMLMMTTAFESRGLHRIAKVPSASAVGAEALVRAPTLAISPNPARASSGAIIRWSTTTAQRITLSVYDTSGRLVKDLLGREQRVAASGAVHWDGRATDGTPAPAGIYFCRMRDEAGGEVGCKLTFLR